MEGSQDEAAAEEAMRVARFHALQIGFTGEDLNDGVMEIAEHMLEKDIPSGPGRAAWMHQTARHFALNLVARQRRERKREILSDDVTETAKAARMWATVADAMTPEKRVLLAELRERMRAAFAEISEGAQELLRRHLQGETIEELAQTTGTTPGTIKSRIHRACRRVRRTLVRKGLSREEACEYLVPCAYDVLSEAPLETDE